MAKCNLSIELDSENDHVIGGDSVSGTVIVNVDADVQCKGLEVKTAWSTHGYGNVRSGVGETTNLFSGPWVAGQTYRYRFELKTAPWPPTYHGHYLNIDHGIEARAKIPWGFDPKANVPLHVTPVAGPEATLPAGGTTSSGVLGAVGVIFFVVFFGVFAVMMLINPFAWILALLVGSVAGSWWFFFRFLPRFRLGEVGFNLTSERVSPGQMLAGELVLHPKRDVRLNRIAWTVEAKEVCVSGSGSNRTTRTHEIHSQEFEIVGPTTLIGGKQVRFPLQAALPTEPIYSIDLSDNDLTWRSALRIDIPRWPDWTKSINFLVVPATALASPDGTATAGARQRMRDPQAGQAPIKRPAETSPPTITFEETVRHIWSARGDAEKREILVSAVEGIVFDVRAIVERRLLYGNDDPAAYRDGYVVAARYPNPELPLTLFIPHGLADDFEQASAQQWQGRGSIVGYDERHGRLQVRVET